MARFSPVKTDDTSCEARRRGIYGEAAGADLMLRRETCIRDFGPPAPLLRPFCPWWKGFLVVVIDIITITPQTPTGCLWGADEMHTAQGRAF